MVVGLVLLVKGADWLVDGASKLAKRLGVTDLVIGLTIVGYLYKRGIEKNQMGYASAVGLVLLVVALGINMVQLIATGTFKKEEK